jgi:hypothetical protein
VFLVATMPRRAAAIPAIWTSRISMVRPTRRRFAAIPAAVFAAALIAHAEDALRRLEEGTEVPPLIEVIEERR